MGKIKKENNGVLYHIILIAFSNILIAAAGVLNGFVLPKVMEVTEYGFYKIFSLYASYITLLHFGFIDGIYIVFAGKRFDELDKLSFRCYSRLLLLIESFLTLIVIGISFFLPGQYKFIFIMLSLNIVSMNYILYLQYISQVTERFNELSWRNIVKAGLNVICAVTLFLLFRFSKYQTTSKLYICIYSSINIILAFWYVITYRELVFGKARKFSEETKEILSLFKIGFPYTIASLLASLILTIDRQFVSILFTTEEYAIYAFAYNMVALITTAISAISTVLYPYLKKKSEEVGKTLPRIRDAISILISLMLLSFFVLVYIVQWILPKYTNSLQIFYVILPALLFSTVITLSLVNYFKILKKQRIYLIISAITVLLSIGANYIAYYFYGTMESISWASFIVSVIWYLISCFYFWWKEKVPFLKNFFYLSFMSITFYLIGYFFKSWVGLIVYCSLFIIITLMFNFKLIKDVCLKIRRKQ